MLTDRMGGWKQLAVSAGELPKGTSIYYIYI